MIEKVISIGQRERIYLDSLYDLRKARITSDRIDVLRQMTGYAHTDAKTPEGELKALELCLIAEMADLVA